VGGKEAFNMVYLAAGVGLPLLLQYFIDGIANKRRICYPKKDMERMRG
jgi:hypothetical protein